MPIFGDIETLIKAIGYIGIFGIVFAESGLFLGFFLPGDSLLFTAGFLAAQGYLEIAVLTVVCFVGAVLGDNFGYAFGRKYGPRLFKKEESLIFSTRNLERTRVFYHQHGGKAVIFARFIPGIRTFAPILAGVGNMHYRTFLVFNIAGALLWACGLTWFGYLLGNVLPNADKYLFPIVVAIIIASVIPGIIHFFHDKEQRRQFTKLFTRPRVKKS